MKREAEEWKDFPRGLHILVADSDAHSLEEIRRKLESFHYSVTTFSSGQAAAQALQEEPWSFQLVLVEASNDGVLEFARHAPTIVMSQTEEMAIVMKSIASGAVDFLRKPVSEEKLQNLWQHVARKILTGGLFKHARSATLQGDQLPSNMKSCKQESLGSGNLSNQLGSGSVSTLLLDDEAEISESLLTTRRGSANFDEHHTSVIDTGDFEMESMFKPSDAESKPGHYDVAEEDTDNSTIIDAGVHRKKQTRTDRKKAKVDWTPELHQRFVQAVEKLGLEKAIPSQILKLMNVKCLTRHNIASHLQKYRAHKRLRASEPCKSFETKVWTKTKRDGTVPIQPRPVYPFAQPGHVWGIPVWSPWCQQPAVTTTIPAAVPVSCVQGQRGTMSSTAQEMLNTAIQETLSNPSTPLPIGLKSPSVERVMAELQSRGLTILKRGTAP